MGTPSVLPRPRTARRARPVVELSEVMITHEDEIAAHARRVIRVRDGQIVEDSGARYAAEVGSAA